MASFIVFEGGAAPGANAQKHHQSVQGADGAPPPVAATRQVAQVQGVLDDLQDRRRKDFALCLALRDELERLGLEDLIQARELCELLFDRLGDHADIQGHRRALTA
jgi:hypothetical protein